MQIFYLLFSVQLLLFQEVFWVSNGVFLFDDVIDSFFSVFIEEFVVFSEFLFSGLLGYCLILFVLIFCEFSEEQDVCWLILIVLLVSLIYEWLCCVGLNCECILLLQVKDNVVVLVFSCEVLCLGCSYIVVSWLELLSWVVCK